MTIKRKKRLLSPIQFGILALTIFFTTSVFPSILLAFDDRKPKTYIYAGNINPGQIAELSGEGIVTENYEGVTKISNVSGPPRNLGATYHFPKGGVLYVEVQGKVQKIILDEDTYVAIPDSKDFKISATSMAGDESGRFHVAVLKTEFYDGIIRNNQDIREFLQDLTSETKTPSSTADAAKMEQVAESAAAREISLATLDKEPGLPSDTMVINEATDKSFASTRKQAIEDKITMVKTWLDDYSRTKQKLAQYREEVAQAAVGVAALSATVQALRNSPHGNVSNHDIEQALKILEDAKKASQKITDLLTEAAEKLADTETQFQTAQSQLETFQGKVDPKEHQDMIDSILGQMDSKLSSGTHDLMRYENIADEAVVGAAGISRMFEQFSDTAKKVEEGKVYGGAIGNAANAFTLGFKAISRFLTQANDGLTNGDYQSMVNHLQRELDSPRLNTKADTKTAAEESTETASSKNTLGVADAIDAGPQKLVQAREINPLSEEVPQSPLDELAPSAPPELGAAQAPPEPEIRDILSGTNPAGEAVDPEDND